MCQCNSPVCNDCQQVKKPHKHAATIKAWADGAKVQRRNPASPSVHCREWHDTKAPHFDENWEYRVKPEPWRVEKYLTMHTFNGQGDFNMTIHRKPSDNLHLTFEDGKLVDAKVLSC